MNLAHRVKLLPHDLRALLLECSKKQLHPRPRSHLKAPVCKRGSSDLDTGFTPRKFPSRFMSSKPSSAYYSEDRGQHSGRVSQEYPKGESFNRRGSPQSPTRVGVTLEPFTENPLTDLDHVHFPVAVATSRHCQLARGLLLGWVCLGRWVPLYRDLKSAYRAPWMNSCKKPTNASGSR